MVPQNVNLIVASIVQFKSVVLWLTRENAILSRDDMKTSGEFSPTDRAERSDSGKRGMR